MAKENKVNGIDKKYLGAFAAAALMLPGCTPSIYNTADRDKTAQVDLKKMKPADVRAVLDIECGPGVNGRIRYYDDGLDFAGGKRTKAGGVDCDIHETKVEQTTATVTEEVVSKKLAKGIEDIFAEPGSAEPKQSIVEPKQSNVEPKLSNAIPRRTVGTSETRTPKQSSKPKAVRRKYITPISVQERISRVKVTTKYVSDPAERRTVFENRGDSGYGNFPVAVGAGLLGLGQAASGVLAPGSSTKVSGSQSQDLRGGDQNMLNITKPQPNHSWKK